MRLYPHTAYSPLAHPLPPPQPLLNATAGNRGAGAAVIVGGGGGSGTGGPPGAVPPTAGQSHWAKDTPTWNRRP